MYTTLGEVMPGAAAKFGDRIALVFQGDEFSYDRLEKLTARLANGLKGLGVASGDRVTLYSQNRWEWIVSYYAVLAVGCGHQPDQRDADTRRGGLRGEGLWRKGTPRLGRQGWRRSSAVKQRPRSSTSSSSATSLPDGATSFNELVEASSDRVPRHRDRSDVDVDHRLHEWHDGPPQGCDVDPSCDRAQQRAHQQHARSNRRRHLLLGPAVLPRVRQRRDERCLLLWGAS